MRNNICSTICLLALGLLIAMSVSVHAESSKIILSDDSGIYILNHDWTTKSLLNDSTSGWIDSSKKGALFYAKNKRIFEYEIANGNIEEIVEGFSYYEISPDSYIFAVVEWDGINFYFVKGQSKTRITNIENLSDFMEYFRFKIIQYKEDSILLVDKNLRLISYDFVQGKVKNLSEIKCVPFGYIQKNEEVLCTDKYFSSAFKLSVNDQVVDNIMSSFKPLLFDKGYLYYEDSKYKFPFSERRSVGRINIESGHNEEIFYDRYVTGMTVVK